jgi:hypothetical protein
MNIQEATEEQLLARHADLEAQIVTLKNEQRAIAKELGFRDSYAVRARALAGMTSEELQRLMQTVKPKGVESAEAVGNAGAEG